MRQKWRKGQCRLIMPRNRMMVTWIVLAQLCLAWIACGANASGPESCDAGVASFADNTSQNGCPWSWSMERTVRSPGAWKGGLRAVSALVKLGLGALRSLLMARPQVPLRVDGTISPEFKSFNAFVEGAEEHFTEKLWTCGPPDGDLPDLACG